jgi:demethylmenaquinone methyltransferase/2-methoxy-6-polyprenyl-1,4-benzoquinol methylase
MFNAIAPRYELINSLFSMGRDAYWRRRAVQLAAVRPDDLVLDIACGTGDFARAFCEAGPRGVVGCDFAHEMLRYAKRKKGVRKILPERPGGCFAQNLPDTFSSPRKKLPDTFFPFSPRWCEADALRLPFADGSSSITSCAFGVRNFDDLDAGLAEMSRVLRPGGRAVILEFTRPGNALVRRLYEIYSTHLMPAAASLISGDRSGAYRYLPRSVVSFLSVEQMCMRLLAAGFGRPTATPLTGGIVTVYIATRD